MIKKAAYAVLGVVMGTLVNLFSLWAGRPSLESQEVLPAKMGTRATPVNLQSAFSSILVVVVLALVCAIVVGVVAKKRLS